MKLWHETIYSALQHQVRERPDKAFLYYEDHAISYADLDRLSAKLAASLLDLGVKRGDRIGLAALNQPEWILTFIAAARIGASIVTLNVRYREAEFDYMLNQSGASTLVCLASIPDFDFKHFLDQLRDRLPEVKRYIFIGESNYPFEGGLNFEDLVSTSPLEDLASAQPFEVAPTDTAIILYTSGTTGKPKGAMITQRSILASAQAQAEHWSIREDDISVGHLPFNHVGGITCTIMVALLTGSSVVLVPSFNPQVVLEVIQRYKVTIFGGVPTMYVMLLSSPAFPDTDLSSVRLCAAGGSNVEPELCRSISSGFPNGTVLNLYGLSESSGACVLSRLDDDLMTFSATLGVPIGDFQARVVGEGGEVKEDGEVGELQIKGDCVAAGYYGMPEETAQTFSSDGWLSTGDMAAIRPDGHIELKGRRKEMYIQGGYNVYPVEVENVLGMHPKVAIAAGIGVPDPVLGEVGRFYIVPKPGETPTPEELEEYCRERLADYKVPRQFVIRTELPLTPVGKVAKAKLREEWEEGQG